MPTLKVFRLTPRTLIIDFPVIPKSEQVKQKNYSLQKILTTCVL
jgi:hypothetical protein